MSPRTRFFTVAGIVVLLVGAMTIVVYSMVSYSWGIASYRRKIRELDAGHYDAAIALFNTASRKKLGATNLSYVYANRGWSYLQKRMNAEAIRDLSESIRLNALFASAILNRGLAYYREGEFGKALDDYTRVISLDPNNAVAYHGRGQIFDDRGDWVKAITDYSEAIRCDLGNAQYFVDRGMAFAANNELDPAIANFEAAIGVNPTHAGAYIQRAAAYSSKGNPTKGVADVTEAIRQRPEAVRLRYARAFIYTDRGALEDAIADCNEALRIAPDYEHGYFGRARAEARARDWDKVVRDTAIALELDPTLSYAHHLRGRGLTAEGKFDEAISEFNEALRLEPGLQWSLIWRATNYGYRGEYSHALQELRQTLERFPRAEAPHLGLAWFLATCPVAAYRNGAQAIAEGLKGCEISHWGNWYAVDTLAAAYAENGDFDRAIQLTNLALGLPGSAPKDKVMMEEHLSLCESRIAMRDTGPSGGSRNLIEQGVSAYARNDYDRALACFNAVLPPNPGASISAALFPFLYDRKEKISDVPWSRPEGRQLSNAYYYRGLTYQRKEQWENAIADFTTVVGREPESVAALRERGVTYCMKGETERGLRDFDEVTRLKPNDALVYMLRADTLQLTKQWDAAIESAARAIQLDPTLAVAYYTRGRAYYGKRQFEEAVRDFCEADRLDPRQPSSILARARTFGAKGDYKLSQRDFLEAVERFPRAAEAHNALAWFLATCPDAAYRNAPDAVMHANSACEITQRKQADYLDTLAAAYAEAGDFDQAIQCVTQAIGLLKPDAKNRKEIEGHLALFQRKEAYHAKQSD